MLSALLALALAQPAPMPGASDGRCRYTRTRFSRTCSSGPLFEFAPTSGAGMTAECAGTAISDTQGRAITISRAGSVYCTRGPLNDGIDVGDMIVIGSSLPRVTAGDNSGIVGLLIENASTNSVLQSETLDNAAWTATAVVTPNTVQSPANTTTADELNDSSAVAVQGVSQAVTTGLLRLSAFGCYVRAGTASSVTVSMVGTGNSAGDCTATSTGLSGTTWRRVQCASPAAYAAGLTAVTLTVGVGDSAAVTGTINVWGCQFEQVNPATSGLGQAYLTSYITTTTVAVTRNAETTNDFGAAFAAPLVSSGSASVTVVLPYTPNASSGVGSFVFSGGSGRELYFLGTTVRALDGTNTALHAHSISANVARRLGSSWTGATMTAYDLTGGSSTAAAFDGTMEATSFTVGWSASNLTPNGVIKQVCADPSPTRCLQ